MIFLNLLFGNSPELAVALVDNHNACINIGWEWRNPGSFPIRNRLDFAVSYHVNRQHTPESHLPGTLSQCCPQIALVDQIERPLIVIETDVCNIFELASFADRLCGSDSG